VRYVVVFDSDPFGGTAVPDLRRIAERMPTLLRSAGLDGADVGFAGDTAIAEGTVHAVAADMVRVGVATLLVDFLLLAVFLRSLVAPWYLLGASVLALLATLGIATTFFQQTLGENGLMTYVPFITAVLLVSLGSDYNVFVVGRIWEDARTRPLRDAVAEATPRAARAITVAGLALAFSFALLALVPLLEFRQIAFTMAVGVLIDALVVRTLLVPSLISVVGSASGWPGRALRRR
jgi:RND superfamily putative drug exporter